MALEAPHVYILKAEHTLYVMLGTITVIYSNGYLILDPLHLYSCLCISTLLLKLYNFYIFNYNFIY